MNYTDEMPPVGILPVGAVDPFSADDAQEEITNRLYGRLKPFQEAIQAIQNELYSAACLADNDTKQHLALAYHSLRLGWYALERDEAAKVKEILARVKREADRLTELPNGQPIG